MTERRLDRRAIVALLGAMACAVAVGLVFSLVPVDSSETVTSGSSGSGVVTTVTSESTTLLEGEGPSVLLVLALPIVPAAVALVRRRRSVSLVAGWATVAFCLLGSMSIGLFYLPVAVLLFLAASCQRDVVDELTGAQRRRRADVCLRVAFALAAVAAVGLATLPLRNVTDDGGAALVVLAALAIPVALAAVPLRWRRRSTSLVVGWSLVVLGLLGATLLGLYFVPSGLLILVAAHWQRAPVQEAAAASRQ